VCEYRNADWTWGSLQGNILTRGIVDLQQVAVYDGVYTELPGSMIYAEMPPVGRTVRQGEICTSVLSGLWLGEVQAMVSGTIVEVNGKLEREPGMLRSGSHDEGWLVKIAASDFSELADLMPMPAPVSEAPADSAEGARTGGTGALKPAPSRA